MAFIVTFPNNSGTARLPLRGTIIAFDMDRAQRFETREAAEAALAKAKPFHKLTTFKAARIEEVR